MSDNPFEVIDEKVVGKVTTVICRTKPATTADDIEAWAAKVVDLVVREGEKLPEDMDVSHFEPL